jgi:SARP family transcriptional regulator, regulator of embCAB operon
VRYEILGPLRVADGEGERGVSAQKVGTLLAVLLIRAGHLVPAEALRAEIWDGNPPRRATAGLHVYVSQLRKFLHRDDHPDSPIVTRPPGYQLQLGEDELDLHEFSRLTDRGRQQMHVGAYGEAARCLEQALAMGSGPVLCDVVQGPVTTGFVTWLAEERLQCLELAIEAELELGRHRSLVSRLYALTAEHPLREAFYRQLMLALYRSERQADALMVFRSARQVLNAELGLEPGRPLQDLQHAILTADRWLDPPTAA